MSSANGSQVSNDLETPSGIGLGPVELLSVHIRGICEIAITQKGLSPALDLDSVRRTVARRLTQEIASFLPLPMLRQRSSWFPAAAAFSVGDDLQRQFLGLVIVAPRHGAELSPEHGAHAQGPVIKDAFRCDHQDRGGEMAETGGLKSMGRQCSKKLAAIAERVESLLDEGEPPRALAQARESGRFSELRDKGGVLLVLTHKVVIDSESEEICAEFPLSKGTTLTFERPKTNVARLIATRDGTASSYRHVLPVREGSRMVEMGTKTLPLEPRKSLPPGFLAESEHPLLEIFQPSYPEAYFLYRDRLVLGELQQVGGEHLPFAGGETRADVLTGGGVAVTRGRNLAAKGLGLGVAGGLGALFMGNAKEKVHDTRVAHLVIEGPNWATRTACLVTNGAAAMDFAQRVNVTARNYVASAAKPLSATPQLD